VHFDPRVAQPLTDITMVGDVPIPVEIPAPPAIPALPTLPPVPIPDVKSHIEVAVHGAEYAWDDVRSWVSDRFHSLLNFGTAVVGTSFQDVQNIVDVAMSVEQTAWASFVSELTGWISQGLSDVGSLELDLSVAARKAEVWLYQYINGAIDGTLSLTEGAIRGIDATIAQQWEDTVHGIEFVAEAIKAWAIDNIYSPLLDDVTGLGDRTLVGLETVLADAKAYADDLVHNEALTRAAAIAGIAAAAAAAASWIDDCGEPMCQVTGPKTDWGKWLKLFGPLALWAMLAAVAAEDPHAMETLAQDLGRALGPTLEAWTAGALIGGSGFPAQPGNVGGAIGKNPLGLG